MTSNHARFLRYGLAVCAVAASALLVLRSAESTHPHVGPLPDGGFLLNSGWTIRPAGDQVPVDTLPLSSVVSPNGKYLLVLNCGFNPPSISVIDLGTKKELSRTPAQDAWFGLTFAPGTNRVFVGGGASGLVKEFAFNPDSGALTAGREYPAIADLKNKGNAFIGDVAVDSKAHLLYAANLYNDSVSVINLQSGTLIDQWKVGRRPYRLLLAPGDTELFVTSWADASVYQYDPNSGKQIARTRVGPHTTDMLLSMRPVPTETGESSSYIGRLFVTAGNTNNVYAYGIAKDGNLTQIESINVSLSPMHPLGMTPSALAMDKDARHLYIVCSDANAVAVADISGPHTDVVGFLPTGWYPTAVRSLEDGRLVVLNGKGLGSKPNPDGPNPTIVRHDVPGYVAHQQTGTVSFIDPFESEALAQFTKTVVSNSPYRDEILQNPVTDQQVAFFARTPDHASPIQHVIYIIKENRTYDQVFGDMPQGNGDKSLVLFGEQYTPNEHELARQFILYDNFYENADVSAEGHNWANAAIAPDYTVRTWPAEYSGRFKQYTYEGTEPANTPPAGYIWDNALQAGLTVRDYGEWDEAMPAKSSDESLPGKPSSEGSQIKSIQDPALEGHVDMNYRGWDLGYPDVDRAHEFIREWKDFESKGDAPNFMVVRLGNDHTQGMRPKALTPFSYVADNDEAVGLLVDAVSHSKLWASTAICIIEDDAQNGPDHVDSHRAPAFLISAYTRRGITDSTMYNQMSMLRSIELMLGLRPMTHYDAAARPMFGTFSRQADLKPYNALPPKSSTTERNPDHGPGATASMHMDFSAPDKVEDDDLTAVLYAGLKHTHPPTPTRSGFAH